MQSMFVLIFPEFDLHKVVITLPRLAIHSLFSDWTGAGEKGLVTLHGLQLVCVNQECY